VPALSHEPLFSWGLKPPLLLTVERGSLHGIDKLAIVEVFDSLIRILVTLLST
jgi:hypothetical protein